MNMYSIQHSWNTENALKSTIHYPIKASYMMMALFTSEYAYVQAH